jgi:prolyl 4-hydroxylase
MTTTTLIALIASLIATTHPGANATAAVRGGGIATHPSHDPAFFDGPADPEAEARISQPGEFKVVLPRLSSLPEPPWMEQISWEPRAFVYHNFLTPEECDHLIALATNAGPDGMKQATVVDPKTGATYPSAQRTSSGHFLLRDQDPIVTRIEERISAFAMIPADHGEGMQILRYRRGQLYEPHYDYFTDKKNLRWYGQRVATVLMYLSDVEAGGETVFPKHGAWIEPDEMDVRGRSNSQSASQCARGKLHVRPRRGDALLFHNVHLNGHEDPTSLHGGCAVLGGTKWTATKWMRAVSLFLVIFGYFLVIFGYFWLFLVMFVRAIGLTSTSCFVLQGPYEAEREIKRRAEIAEYWEEKARRGEGIGEESRGKLNERGNLET